MIIELKQTDNVSALFDGWQETLIWSCLQQTMGHVYVHSESEPEDKVAKEPASAMAFLGDFCFFAGVPCKELVLYKPEHCKQDFMIMVPHDEDWADMIEECYSDKARRVIRYAMKKEPDIFDREQLQKAVATLSPVYEIKRMDEELFRLCKTIPWCGDWVSQYPDFAMYRKYGHGVIILKDGEPVSGASSYAGYRSGIEIEIDTREDYRRKGLAYICGAKLILECINQGWYPSWDAQNKWSVALAEKLGYHFDYEYTAFEIQGY